MPLDETNRTTCTSPAPAGDPPARTAIDANGPSPGRTVAVTRWREAPFEVQVAWTVIDYHLVQRCRRCHPDGWCPRIAVARARILAWRRVRHLW